MRILIHGINFSPELTGIGKYSGEMAAWLADQGHEVRVVTAPPYYPQWKIADGFANGWHREVIMPDSTSKTDKAGSLVVYRCPLWVPNKPSGLKRILHLASFALSSFPIMLSQIFWRPNLVLVVEPPLFCAPQSWIVARLSGAKAWLHIQDFEVDAAFDLGMLKGSLLRRLVTAAERWLLRRFDRVSTISQRMVDRLFAKGVSEENTVLFPNWVDLNTIASKQALDVKSKVDNNSCSYRTELAIGSDSIVALYSGNMGAKQGLEILAQSATLLHDSPEIVFVFCGNGAGREDLVLQCSGLNNVRFIDLQPLERLGELLGMADIHLLPQRADAADLVMPSKLTGMLASGRPVVATANPNTELANVVKNFGCVVPPQQPDAFAKAIMTLVEDADLRLKLGVAGSSYAEEYLDRDVVLARFQNEVTKILG